VALEEVTNQHLTDQQPRCEIGKIRTAEGECRRLGEVHLDGSLLCTAHAEFLRWESRSEMLLGTVFQWLESTDGEADELRVRRVEKQRNEVVEELRFNRERISLIRDVLLKDQDRTT
jgi:hypothetical protein